jgi:hypothetical protein
MRIRDPGWKKFGSRINIPVPQHCQRPFLTYLQEIHQKGLDEVARIEEEMKEILEEMGFSNLTLPQFIDMIRYVAFLIFDICYPYWFH